MKTKKTEPEDTRPKFYYVDPPLEAIGVKVPKRRKTRLMLITLGPAYNENFEAAEWARSSRLFIVTELFDTVVNERVLLA